MRKRVPEIFGGAKGSVEQADWHFDHVATLLS